MVISKNYLPFISQWYLLKSEPKINEMKKIALISICVLVSIFLIGGLIAFNYSFSSRGGLPNDF